MDVELLLPLRSDGDAHAGPRAFLPPVGQPHQHAALLEYRHFLQEPVRLLGRPGQRLVDVARIDQFLDERTGLRSQVDGREQFHQRLLVLGAGVLLKGLAQRLILHPRTARQARCVGGQKGERILRVAAVLGQMETDPPDLVPERGPLLQESPTRPARKRQPGLAPTLSRSCQTSSERRIGHVFGALHGRHAQEQRGQFRGGGRRDLAELGIGGSGVWQSSVRYLAAKSRQYAREGGRGASNFSVASAKSPSAWHAAKAFATLPSRPTTAASAELSRKPASSTAAP